MKLNIYNTFSLSFLVFVFLASSQLIFSQEKLLGELTLENNTSAIGEQFITINKERVLSGRSIMSPAEIETSAQTSAKISLPKTGLFRIDVNSKMNLYFDNASISGDLLQGNITVDALPFTKFNILTSDGAITASNISNENVFVVNLVNKKTQVKVLAGEVLFNGVLLIAGQTYPAELGKPDALKTNNSSSSGSSNIILIVLGVAAAVAVVAAVSLSGGDDNSSISPVR